MDRPNVGDGNDRPQQDDPPVTGQVPAVGDRPPSSQRLADLVIRPWPRQRARRTRWVILGLLVAAPLVATGVTWWGVATNRSTTVVEAQGPRAESTLLVEASALGIDLARSEMSFRLVFRPQGDIARNDVLGEPVAIGVNDVSGSTLLRFDEGEVMEPRTIAIGVGGSELLRYPFDVYRTDLVLFAVTDPDEDGGGDPLELDVALDVSLVDFGVTADVERSPDAARISLEMGRRGSVIVWVGFFMVLVWAIALSVAATTWFIVVFSDEAPFWLYALLAGVLFALPTLRAGLPGSPPYGSLVDWAAFYWGIAIVAAALVTLLVVWNVEARVRVRETRDAHSAASDDDSDEVNGPASTP